MQAATARIAELEAELAEMKDRWMRAEAETANVRARAHREVNETPPVRRAEIRPGRGRGGREPAPRPRQPAARAAGEPEIVTRLREGLDGIERNFLGVLERNGIKREDPIGAPFDPNLHQAMAEQESAAHPPGSVMQAWTPAWTLNGRLLRPAMVVVAKAPPGEITASGPSWTPPPDAIAPAHGRESPDLGPLARTACTPIHPCHTDPVGTLAVLRVARVR